jgi:hypothetical protein
MVKAGLIIGGIMLVIGSVGAWFFPLLCVPCLALFAGIGGGYLAGQFDRPGTSRLAARTGAGAGAIGGIGALLAHLIGGTITALTTGQDTAAAISNYFGSGANPLDNPVGYYGGALGAACCLGLFEIALLAGLGALGGMLWYQITNKGGTPAAM